MLLPLCVTPITSRITRKKITIEQRKKGSVCPIHSRKTSSFIYGVFYWRSKIGCWNIVIQNPDVAKLWSLHCSRDMSRVWDEQKRARVLIFAIILESHPNIAGAEGFRTVTFFPASHIGTNCGFLHSGNNQCSKNKWRLCLWSPSELKQCLPYWFAHIYSTNNLKPQSEQEGCIFLCLTI